MSCPMTELLFFIYFIFFFYSYNKSFWQMISLNVYALYFYMEISDTLQPLYNMVCYNTVLDITRFKDGSQKCIDYIEK